MLNDTLGKVRNAPISSCTLNSDLKLLLPTWYICEPGSGPLADNSAILGARNPRAMFAFSKNLSEKLYAAPKLPLKPLNVLFNAANCGVTFGAVVGFGPVYSKGYLP